LVIVGEEDMIFPAESQAFIDGIPNSKLVVVEKAGHFPMLEQPLEFNRALRGFLEKYAKPAETVHQLHL
jgi:3-oxoadipate enol-lactonase